MELFNKYFSELNKTGIIYGIAGRTENYPENICGDIDIIISPEAFKDFWIFMRNIRKVNIRWIQTISHEITAYYIIIVQSDDSEHHIIKPDVCSDYYKDGTLVLKADYLLENRCYNKKGFYQLAPEKEFIYYVLKKIKKGSLNQEQFDHLTKQWRKNSIACKATLSTFFPKNVQEKIIDSFEQNNLIEFKSNIGLFKNELHKNLKFSFKDFILKLFNRLNRILKPTGLVVAFMGPDGCGKTTIIKGVSDDLKELFRNYKQFHLFPKEIKNSESEPNPQGKKPRGFFGSIFKLLYFGYLYVLGHWIKVFPLKVRSTLIIYDRYYHDILVDQKRYRHGADKIWIKFFSFFIPKPDMWILLNAPADIIQSRKSEVSFEETTRQIDAYNQLFRNLKNAHIVNANQPAQQVIHDTESLIIEYLEQRTAARYKNL
ncbi:MAG: hypothetical protein ACQERU_05875, partial [Bacteroidota bacterium]